MSFVIRMRRGVVRLVCVVQMAFGRRKLRLLAQMARDLRLNEENCRSAKDACWRNFIVNHLLLLIAFRHLWKALEK